MDCPVENTDSTRTLSSQPQVVSMDQWRMPDWLRRVSDCVDRGEFDRAQEGLTQERIQQIQGLAMPEKGFILVAVAGLLKRMSQWEPAESLYRQLLAQCPTNTSLLNEMANLLAEQGKKQPAVSYLKRAIEVDPHDPRLWHNLVRIGAKEDLQRFNEEHVLKSVRCWCGGALETSVHPAYGQCVACHTFVLLRQYSPGQLNAFYTFDHYWHTQTQVKRYPAIEQRVDEDFGDRIPVLFEWLRKCIETYQPFPINLLEIGCAHGGFLHYCRQHGIADVVGNEPDEATCCFAKQTFDLPYLVSDLFPDVTLPFEQFGVIVGFDVVEHFDEPVRALKKVAALLGSTGICMFQLPCYRDEDASWSPFKPPEHIYLYDEQNIHKLFDCAGIEILEIEQGCFKYNMFVVGCVAESSHGRVRSGV